MTRIESLLSARLFLQPQVVGDRLYFASNLGGHLSLYVMDHGGSVPEPLLPPDIALQNPHLLPGRLYSVFPKIRRILLMLDHDGDENYQPMLLPLDGGYPEPVFAETFANRRVHMGNADLRRSIVYFAAESRQESMIYAYQANLEKRTLVPQGQSKWGGGADGVNEAHTKAVLVDGYTAADNVLYLWEKGSAGRRLLHGKPLEERKPGEAVPLSGIHSTHFLRGDRALVFHTTLFDDAGGLGYLDLAAGSEPRPVAVTGAAHRGRGELVALEHLRGDRYVVHYNIDGASWAYEARLDARATTMRLGRVLVGKGELSAGLLESLRYDREKDRYALAFSTATSPTQLYTLEGRERKRVRHTAERVLGIPQKRLAAGEDASFVSFDGTHVSARLYLPARASGFRGARPLVYYVHGGPQSQERPDFAWFSMPLIQFLTLRGFAVFVPNVRGSTGYGQAYMKAVDRDWGGKDRLDHVHAVTKVLPHDRRLDTARVAVVGRSYGGYMSLTLAARHPELWAAAVDMFGPYDLLTFMDRLPETWKPYFALAVGDPAKDREFLVERSPQTHVGNLRCPLLVIQGKNDPRVVERESRDVVESLRAKGKQVDYLVFEDEGHDVLKLKNRVRCYNAITDFLQKHLNP